MKSSILSKVLALLTIISKSQKPMTFSDLVAASGMNKSTIHRLLAICVEEKLVQVDRQRKVYLLGPTVFDLVRYAHSGYDIQAVALDEMLRLHGLYGGNVTIGVPSGHEVVYLRLLESNSTNGPTQRQGMREPFHCSASGKALLAFLPDRVIDAKLSDHEFEKYTARTITDPVSFKAALEHVRHTGFGQNDREEYEYFCGISAPIFNYQAEPIAVLNIWCVQSQHPMSEMEGWAAELIASADRVTGLIGGVRPDVDSLRGGAV